MKKYLVTVNKVIFPYNSPDIIEEIELSPNARVLTREQVMKSLLALGEGYAVSREDYEDVCDDLFGKESDGV